MRIKYFNERTGAVSVAEATDVDYNILKNRFYVKTERGYTLSFYINSRNFDEMVQTLVKYGWIDLTTELLVNVLKE